MSIMKTELPYLSREKNRHGTECLFVRRHGKRIRIREPENTPAFAKAYSDALDALEKPFEAAERVRKEAAKAGTIGWLATRYFAECEEYKGLYELEGVVLRLLRSRHAAVQRIERLVR